MSVYQQAIRRKTRGHCDVLDITADVERIVQQSGVRTGIVNVSGVGSTLGVATIEFEPGAVQDLRDALDRIAPVHDGYAHNQKWGDHNGFAHLRSALMGTSRSFAVLCGELRLGTWQQVILCDFDDRPREREITVTVYGE